MTVAETTPQILRNGRSLQQYALEQGNWSRANETLHRSRRINWNLFLVEKNPSLYKFFQMLAL